MSLIGIEQYIMACDMEALTKSDMEPVVCRWRRADNNVTDGVTGSSRLLTLQKSHLKQTGGGGRHDTPCTTIYKY